MFDNNLYKIISPKSLYGWMQINKNLRFNKEPN